MSEAPNSPLSTFISLRVAVAQVKAKARRPIYGELDRQRLLALINEGYKLCAAAKMCGMCRHTARRLLRAA